MPGSSWFPESFSRSIDPVAGNPFRADDLRHQRWADATQAAEVEARVLHTEFLKLEVHSWEQLDRWLLHLHFNRFDIWARRYVHVVWAAEMLDGFRQWLISYAGSVLETAEQQLEGPDALRMQVLLELRSRLAARMEHWMGEAHGYLISQRRQREAEQQGAGKPGLQLAPPTTHADGHDDRGGLAMDTFEIPSRDGSVKVTYQEQEPTDVERNLSTREGRAAAVDEILASATAIAGERVGKKHLSQALGHTNAKSVQNWLRVGTTPPGTAATDRNMRRVLRAGPDELVQQLRRGGRLTGP